MSAHRMIALFFVVCVCFACQQPPQPTTVTSNTQPTPLPLPTPGYYPRDIENYIKDHRQESLQPLWQLLGLPDLGLPDFGDSFSDESIRLFTFYVGGHRQVAILRLSSSIDTYLYLFFQTGKMRTDWEFVSYHDEPYVKYGLPGDPRIEFLGEHYWVVLPSRGWFGTGISAIYQTWYSLKQKPAKVVFTESEHSQHSWPNDLAISDDCAIVTKQVRNQGGTVTLGCRFGWSSGKTGRSIWQHSSRSVYQWDEKGDTFRLLLAVSTEPHHYAKKFYLKEDVGFDESIPLYESELWRVVRFGNHYQRTWLRAYLKEISANTASKRRLLEALRSAR